MTQVPQGACDDASRDGAVSSRVVVQVQVPDGIVPSSVTVTFQPDTAEQFDRIVDACGGPVEFTALLGFAFAEIEGGRAHVMRPTGSPPQDLFMDAFHERVQVAKGERCPVPDTSEDVPF